MYFYIKILVQLGINIAESVFSAGKHCLCLCWMYNRDGLIDVHVQWFPVGPSLWSWGAVRNSGLLLLAPHRCYIYIFIYKALGLWNRHQLTPHKRQRWLRPSHSELHQGFAAATSLLWPSHKSADSIAVHCPPLSSSQADEATFPSSPSASHYSSTVIVTAISAVLWWHLRLLSQFFFNYRNA